MSASGAVAGIEVYFGGASRSLYGNGRKTEGWPFDENMDESNLIGCPFCGDWVGYLSHSPAVLKCAEYFVYNRFTHGRRRN